MRRHFLKHRRKACWTVAKPFLWALLAALIASYWPAGAAANRAAEADGTSRITISGASNAPVVEFRDGDYILSNSKIQPVSGWERKPSPQIYRLPETKWRAGDIHTLWAKHRFDRSSLRAGPFALYMVSTRSQFAVNLNGVEVFRNFASESDQKITWYRPYLVQLPESALRPGVNEIMVRAFSEESVGVGRVVIGPYTIVEDYYTRQFFWRITAPMIASSSSLLLGLFALLLWLQRREELELGYLAASAIFYFFRNFQYFGEDAPFNLIAFNGLSVAATLLAMVAAFCFYISYLKVQRFQTIINILVMAVIPYTLVHWYFQLSNFMLYLPTLVLVLAAIYLGSRNILEKPSVEKSAWLLVMLMLLVFGVYDAHLASTGYVWQGSGFYIAVFNAFFSLIAFLLTFGLRAIAAFSALGEANVTLERAVAKTRAELASSENARQILLVDTAVASERDRLMQEIHDGIGSNLITALAVARQQNQPASTIKTLRRALADLKITVDSLEPVEGDLVALVGNLRHRMAGDMRDAGISCKWEVKQCAQIPWLDAANALHVLRIFQEAIGNVLTHSGATEMRIGCAEAERNGVAGVAAFVADNGAGFDPAANSPGKGLSNIHARASSLHGFLSCESNAGAGTIVTLWLPYTRVIPG